MSEALILVVNAGSTSLKFAVYGVAADAPPVPMARGSIDHSHGHVVVHAHAPDASPLDTPSLPHDVIARLDAGSLGDVLADWVALLFPGLSVVAVGHRVVHGGEGYRGSIRIGGSDMRVLEGLISLAPMHQPANLALIRNMQRLYPAAAQIASFDTSFHLSQDRITRLYALPRHYYDEGVRRFGFHGLSYRYVSKALQPHLPRGVRRLVVAHLGGGCSVCGLIDSASAACSTGLTPLDGVPMATRCGALDPGALLHLMLDTGLSAAQLRDLLYRESGLLGLSEISADVRVLLASDAPAAHDALAVFVRRTAREIVAIAGEIGGIDALAFTGGIGQNCAPVRARIIEHLDWLGMHIAANANDEGPVRRPPGSATCISSAACAVSCWAIATDEESVIASDTASLIARAADAAPA